MRGRPQARKHRRVNKAKRNKERGRYKKRQADEMRDAELRSAAKLDRKGFAAAAWLARQSAAQIADDPVRST